MYKYFGSGVVLTLLGFVLAYQFVDPAPPERFSIATGGEDGAYFAFGQAYRRLLAEERVTLDVEPSAGSVENLAKLRDPSSGINVAFVQGGVAEPADRADPSLIALGSLYFEPLWVFHRAGSGVASLGSLAGRRLAVGPVGSGTRKVALQLLADNAIDDAELFDEGGTAAAEKLLAGEIDALFLVASARSPVVAGLLREPGVFLLSFERAEAYTRLHRFLSSVVLPRGVIDLSADLPESDVTLLAPAATLVASERLHPALISLLLQTAREVHRPGGLFESPGQFPAPKYVDFPVNKDVRRFYKSGPPFLQRYLPFWAATLIDRMLVMLLPLVALMVPLVKLLPPLYRWRMRRRIICWYRDLLATDPDANPGTGREAALRELARIEDEVGKVHVPLSFADQLYQLRAHINLVRSKLTGKASDSGTPTESGAGPGAGRAA